MRLRADKAAYRISLWVGEHWLEAAAILGAIALAGGCVVGVLLNAGWDGVSTFEGCYGVALAIGIFLWTLAGFSQREVDRRRRAADEFAQAVGRTQFGHSQLADWHREELARVLRVPEEQIENELLLWLVEQNNVQGGRELLAITQRYWFLRLVSRGRGGKQTFDLSTGEPL
jgi:hypothetical protein